MMGNGRMANRGFFRGALVAAMVAVAFAADAAPPGMATAISCATLPSFWKVNVGVDDVSACLDLGNGFAGAAHGLLLAGREGARIGVIFLHGRGAHPNSAVVRQLRHALFHRGYTTLSIQNPVPGDANGNGIATDFSDYVADSRLEPGFVIPETSARLRQAMAFLAKRGVEEIVLAGFSLGSRLAAIHIARGRRPGDLAIRGFIGIGVLANGDEPYNHLTSLGEIALPVLDIFGDNDTPAVRTAAARKAAYGGDSANYTQIALDCSDEVTGNDCHKLRGALKGADGAPLETVVGAWVDRIAPLGKAP